MFPNAFVPVEIDWLFHLWHICIHITIMTVQHRHAMVFKAHHKQFTPCEESVTSTLTVYKQVHDLFAFGYDTFDTLTMVRQFQDV